MANCLWSTLTFLASTSTYGSKVHDVQGKVLCCGSVAWLRMCIRHCSVGEGSDNKYIHYHQVPPDLMENVMEIQKSPLFQAVEEPARFNQYLDGGTSQALSWQLLTLPSPFCSSLGNKLVFLLI